MDLVLAVVHAPTFYDSELSYPCSAYDPLRAPVSGKALGVLEENNFVGVVEASSGFGF